MRLSGAGFSPFPVEGAELHRSNSGVWTQILIEKPLVLLCTPDTNPLTQEMKSSATEHAYPLLLPPSSPLPQTHSQESELCPPFGLWRTPRYQVIFPLMLAAVDVCCVGSWLCKEREFYEGLHVERQFKRSIEGKHPQSQCEDCGSYLWHMAAVVIWGVKCYWIRSVVHYAPSAFIWHSCKWLGNGGSGPLVLRLDLR